MAQRPPGPPRPCFLAVCTPRQRPLPTPAPPRPAPQPPRVQVRGTAAMEALLAATAGVRWALDTGAPLPAWTSPHQAAAALLALFAQLPDSLVPPGVAAVCGHFVPPVGAITTLLAGEWVGHCDGCTHVDAFQLLLDSWCLLCRPSVPGVCAPHACPHAAVAVSLPAPCRQHLARRVGSAAARAGAAQGGAACRQRAVQRADAAGAGGGAGAPLVPGSRCW